MRGPRTGAEPGPNNSSDPGSPGNITAAAARIAARFIRLWGSPPAAAGLAAAAYLWFAYQAGFPNKLNSYHNYYNYLADAFLHGQLHLRRLPPSVHDLAEIEGRSYLYWPPMPAILLMPFVAAAGIGVSDVLFTLVLGAANVALVAAILRVAAGRGIVRLSRFKRGLLVLCFALGSVHLLVAALGRVWFTGQVVGLSFVLLAYRAGLGDERRTRTWALFGVAMAGACATRYHLLACGLWPCCALIHRATPPWRFRHLVAALPIVLTGDLLLLYNAARFGGPFDTGISHMRVAENLAGRMARFGQLNVAYLPENLYNTFVLYPFPGRLREGLGGSVFLLTPLFFAALLTLRSPTRSSLLLWTTVALAALPGLLVLGGGWYQFGPRYSLDFIAPLLLLTASGMRHLPRWLCVALAIVSCVHYSIGVQYFATHS